ncbi:Major viral transcription factor ICP4-like protein, partial [Bienertia sinuspersici]
MCSTVCFPDHVKSLWDDLRDRYSLGNGPCILELKAQIVDCKQRWPVAVYFGELCKLQDELASYSKIPKCTCDAAREYATIFKNSSKFGSIVSTLLMMDPIPSLNVAYAKVISNERKQTVAIAQETRPSSVVGFAISGAAHGRSARDSRICEHCGKKGHEKEKCFDLYGWPDGILKGGVVAAVAASSGGRSFAANVNGSRPNASSHEVNENDKSSAPTLTDEQWSQSLTAIE